MSDNLDRAKEYLNEKWPGVIMKVFVHDDKCCPVHWTKYAVSVGLNFRWRTVKKHLKRYIPGVGVKIK